MTQLIPLAASLGLLGALEAWHWGLVLVGLALAHVEGAGIPASTQLRYCK